MHKYLWAIPVILLVMVLAGCHGEGLGMRTTVAITAPAAGADVPRGVTENITATATATEGVDRVVFKIDGQTVATDTTAPYSYAWDTTGASLGQHTISVIAYDESSPAQTATATRTVTIVQPPTVPPTVSIDSPAAGADVSGEFDVEVSATAQEPGATITEIAVTLDGITKTVTGASGTVTFDSTQVSNGQRTITATATDSAGGGASATRTVTVDNFTVSVQNATVAAGGTVTVSINMTDTTGVAGFAMTINYDASALQIVGGDAGVGKGAAVPGGAFLMPNTATAGVIMVAAAGTTEFNAAEQQILTIEFQAIGGAGATVIDIDEDPGALTPLGFSDTLGSAIDPQPTAVDGTVTIQ